MVIKTLSSTPISEIINVHVQAFAEYELQLNDEELKTMWKRRGFNPTLSFAAFEEDKIVSYTLNGIGNFNGLKMAYDTGTGTLKEYRGKGLATKIFEHSIPFLKAASITHYLLEVLQHNTKAFSVYQKIGFEIAREFNYFVWKNEDINLEIKNIEIPVTIKQLDIEDIEISRFAANDNQYGISNFWDFEPSWQNSFESICRAKEDFICLGAFVAKRLVGYCVFEPNSGDITQIAVDKPFRRKGIASLLLYEISKLNRTAKTKLLNTDISCSSIIDFLKAKNIEIAGKQFEMIKKIS
jgi:ribosomal protein S18 acetylase RimI-like enzyme